MVQPSPQTIRVRELNLDMIQPNSKTYNDKEQGGSKIVVIGKPGCFSPGTEVLMYNGTVKTVENVKRGELVMGDDSTPRTVIELCQGTEKMYRVNPERGESYTVNARHKLVLKSLEYSSGKIIEIKVEDYLNKPKAWRDQWAIFRTAVEFEEQNVTLNPYILGVWLASVIKSEVVEETNDILNSLKGSKHIPLIYKCNSRTNRLQLLAGLIDADGYYNRSENCFDLVKNNKTLAQDIAYVARSLGLICDIKECEKSSLHNGEVQINTYQRLTISGDTHIIPCKILGKHFNSHKYKCFRSRDDALVSSFELEPVGEGEYYGFTINGNHRFLLATFDVVRNTGKSTLIASLLFAKKDIFPVGVVMSGTEDSNGFYRKVFPSTFVFNKYDEEKVGECIKRQKIAKQHLPNPWSVCLIDDCTDDPRIFNKPLQQGIFKRGRHWKMLYILSLQYCMDVKPVIRTNVDGTFILREPNLKNRKSLWENYAGIIPDFKMFCDIMDQLTTNYTALYIHNATRSNNLEDCIFFYKANPVPENFKFGCPEFWEFHNERYNPAYVDPLIP